MHKLYCVIIMPTIVNNVRELRQVPAAQRAYREASNEVMMNPNNNQAFQRMIGARARLYTLQAAYPMWRRRLQMLENVARARITRALQRRKAEILKKRLRKNLGSINLSNPNRAGPDHLPNLVLDMISGHFKKARHI